MLTAGAVLGLALAATPAARAQMPDEETSAEEKVCDDAGLTGAARGLCNAYCEALDCGGENPNASSTECQKVLSQYAAHTEQRIPCARRRCPCWSPRHVDPLLARCEGDASTVTCVDVVLQGQGPIYRTEIECVERIGPIEIIHYLRARIDARIAVYPSCAVANVPPLPNGARSTTVDQAEACQQVLRDRIGDDVCDSLIISP